MLMDVAPFDNHDVRMALKYAMNREEWIQKIRQGYATIGNDHPIGPAMPYYAGDIEQRPYDPDKSRFHRVPPKRLLQQAPSAGQP